MSCASRILCLHSNHIRCRTRCPRLHYASHCAIYHNTAAVSLLSLCNLDLLDHIFELFLVGTLSRHHNTAAVSLLSLCRLDLLDHLFELLLVGTVSRRLHWSSRSAGSSYELFFAALRRRRRLHTPAGFAGVAAAALAAAAAAAPAAADPAVPAAPAYPVPAAVPIFPIM